MYVLPDLKEVKKVVVNGDVIDKQIEPEWLLEDGSPYIPSQQLDC